MVAIGKGLQAERRKPEESESSMSSRIYQLLRDKIISGELPPGTRLRERELADELGVSRVPVRDALPLLEADGFIQTSLRRGARVTPLTMRDVEELFQVRLGVEVYATRLAAEAVRAGASVAPMLNILEESIKALAKGQSSALIYEKNADLHDAIISLANNQLLARMLQPVSGRDRWIFRMTADRDPMAAHHEHEELCNAIAAGDPDLAAALAYRHIERGHQPTLTVLGKLLPED